MSATTSAPPVQPLEGTAEPPTIKYAGRLDDQNGYGWGGAIILMAVFFVIVGGMLLTLMTNHGRVGRGLVLHAAGGLGAFAAVAMVYFLESVGAHEEWLTLTDMAAPFAAAWLGLGIVGFAVGALVQPPAKSRRAR